MAISLSTGDVILIIVFATIPIALLTFVLGAGNALKEIGKGPLSVEFESDLPQRVTDDDASASPAAREAEIRQLLQAKAYRQRQRGEEPLDVDEEMRKMLAPAAVNFDADPALVEEVRQLVVARNGRRIRQGKEPLDVEAEVRRQLEDLENLGQ